MTTRDIKRERVSGGLGRWFREPVWGFEVELQDQHERVNFNGEKEGTDLLCVFELEGGDLGGEGGGEGKGE